VSSGIGEQFDGFFICDFFSDRFRQLVSVVRHLIVIWVFFKKYKLQDSGFSLEEQHSWVPEEEAVP
jgi:NADH:ubiquinone oxidoreductase subunit 4 (subunit M)